MRITDILRAKAMTLDLKAADKEAVIKELVELLYEAGEIKDRKELLRILMAREELGSTGIGQGIGIPHGKTSAVKELVAAFGISRKGINFDSLDGEPVYIFFLLVAPEDIAGPHLKALAKISRLLKDRYFRDRLRAAKDEKEALSIIRDEDQKEG